MRKRDRVGILAFIALLGLVVGLLFAAGGKTVDVLIGDATGVPGETVGRDILVDSQGQLSRGFQVNLAFDGVVLPVAVGVAGSTALPVDWTLTTNLAAPGRLQGYSTSRPPW